MAAQIRIFIAALLLCAVVACRPAGDSATGERAVAPVLLTADARDAHSYARPAEARVTHVSLDLTADFEARRMVGSATLDLEVAPEAHEIVLDTRDLEIREVSNVESGRALQWTLGDADGAHGAPLTVELAGARRIRIDYATSPEAVALQWLTPEQTAGRTQPFLFSQGQAILNRSWIPTQDSPGIRQTWDARIVAPEAVRVVMSADMKTPDGEAVDGENGAGMRAWRFEMVHPVAPYLIAIAAGDIAFRDLGPRTGVWAEPVTLDAAANEFADTERMIAAAELLYGPYRWGRYDMLVLPPSFPYGGMENPRLTFLTPTVIAGDRSLVSLVAHELAHSWSGNLVTNATWNDSWLNEGFTTYIESRIMEQVYGPERAAMLAELSWADLQAGIEAAGGPESPATQLHTEFDDLDPDDWPAGVPYEKGEVFLRTLEHAVGRERFDEWLRGYFDRYAFQPQTSARLLTDLNDHLFADDPELARRIGLERWIFQPGLPENAFHWTSPRFAEIDRLAEGFAANSIALDTDRSQWTTQETLRFINALPRALPPERLATLDRDWGLSSAGNGEIRFAWLMLAIPNRYDPAKDSARQFLLGMGRRKFVLPLFTALMEQNDWSRDFARTLYREARPGYHSVTATSVDEVVGYRPRG